MPNFKILPINAELAQTIRETMVDQEGHSLSVTGGNGYGPCRCCLRQFTPGEPRILFSYRPNPVDHPYNEAGPVFIHAEECEPFHETGAFPSEVENGRVKFPLVFRAYDVEGRMVGAQSLNGETASEAIANLFQNDQVVFAQVRNGLAGCFVAHIERAE